MKSHGLLKTLFFPETTKRKFQTLYFMAIPVKLCNYVFCFIFLRKCDSVANRLEQNFSFFHVVTGRSIRLAVSLESGGSCLNDLAVTTPTV